jgi:hypothetical protein
MSSKFDAKIGIDKLQLNMTEDEPKNLFRTQIIEDGRKTLHEDSIILPGAVQERVPLIPQNPSQAITQLLVQITGTLSLSHWNFETFKDD